MPPNTATPQIKVSVVIPCYNGAAFLRETIDSALAQTYPVLEVIVVDDGSTDDSAVIAESYGPPVRVIRQPNQGESVARNRGIDEAKGDWIAFLDADDLWKPEKIEHQVAYAVPEYVAICSANENLWHREDQVSRTIHVPAIENVRREWILEHGTPFHVSSLMVRRDVKTRFPRWTKYAEDTVYFLDLLADGGKIALVELPLAIYRHHGNNQTGRPEMALRRHETLRSWYSMNVNDFSPEEATRLSRAMTRLENQRLLNQAIASRQAGRAARSIFLYLRVLVGSLFSSTSTQILSTASTGLLGAIAETCRIRKHPMIASQANSTPERSCPTSPIGRESGLPSVSGSGNEP